MIHAKEFYQGWIKIFKNLGADPLDALQVSNSESGVSPSAYNPNGPAVGLIQFLGVTLKGMGWTGTTQEFGNLSDIQQLPYVEKYYAPYKGKLVNKAAIYTATFLPADIDMAADPTAVLVDKNGRRGWAYSPNASFDTNHDLKITVSELTDAIDRACRTSRWRTMYAEYCMVAGIVPQTIPQPAKYDLGTVLGIQQALNKLGFNVGDEDGIPGPKTTAGVAAFQKSANLAVDGIVGPNTRAKLKEKLG